MKRMLSLILCSSLGVLWQTNVAAEWYKATAKPNLVVRDAPDVSGDKLGTVPYGGKVNVLNRIGARESIGGRNGYWVEVEWKNGTGYAFDAFLEPTRTVAETTSDNWFTANAEPNLVVRSQPDVTGGKIGSVPYGGKVRVLKTVSGRESIGGRTGHWVKIEWRGTQGFVFDTFLEPVSE